MVKIRKILLVFAGILLILALLNYQLLHYAFVQAVGQIGIITHAKPVSEVLKLDSLSAEARYKIHLIHEVRDFAVSELGLSGKKNYSSIYFHQGNRLMWVVTACEPFKMEAYEWEFPLFGSFSYKGFFKEQMARNESAKLAGLGYDTNIRNAGGWSTLGILKDPILSSMLNRDTASLADLIIHELTHTTIFVKDEVAYNENLATFIGQEGTKIFLARKFGPDSPILSNYVRTNIDQETFSAYVLQGATQLDSLYGTFQERNYSDSVKKKLKSNGIRFFMNNLHDLDFYNTRYYQFFDDYQPNNTFFMSYLRYRGGLDTFRRELEYEFDNDLRAYIANLKEQYRR